MRSCKKVPGFKNYPWLSVSRKTDPSCSCMEVNISIVESLEKDLSLK
jgi:hypothetical protein